MSYRQCNRRTSGVPHDVDPVQPTEQRAYQSLAILSTGKQCSHKDLPALKQHSLTINMANEDSKKVEMATLSDARVNSIYSE